MKKILIKSNLKIIFRSPIYYLAYSLLLVAFLGFAVLYNGLNPAGFPNFFISFYSLIYYEIAIYLIVFCLAAFFAQKNCLLEEVCFIPKHKIYLSRLTALYLSSSAFLLMPIIYMAVFFFIQDVSVDFLMRAIVYALINWSAIIIFMETIGFLVGYIVRSAYSYLFAIPFTILHSYMNSAIFGSGNLSGIVDTDLPIAHLFSLQRNFLTGGIIDFRGPLIDAEYIVKMLFFFIVSVSMIILLLVICKKKLMVKTSVSLCLCAALAVSSGITYFKLHPTTYINEEKLYITDYETQSYEISSYSGTIRLSEWSKYDISIGIRGEGETLQLRLDQDIKLKSVTSDGVPVSYTHSGDILTIQCLANEFTLDISASGRISYVNSIAARNIYTSVSGCCLPPDFAFLPRIDGDLSQKLFDLTVYSDEFLATNLDYDVKDNKYTIYDQANTACFFTGDFKTFEHDGIRYYAAKYDFTTDVNEIVEKYERRKKFMAYYDTTLCDIQQDEQYCIDQWNNVETVIVISFSYPGMFPSVYDGFAVLHS